MPPRAKKLDRLAPWSVGTAASLFYLSFHSAYYNFDGVACAIAVELGDWAHLVHGNHLAYGVVGLLFYKLWQLLGYAGPALLPLQILDSLLGGIGVGLFCALLGKLRFPRFLSVGAAAGLAVSQAYWFWSLEAQVYLLGVVFIILAAGEALSDEPRPARLGFFHACAILGHVGHVMFLPVVAYRLWKTRANRRVAALYMTALVGTTAGAYAAAARFCIPFTSEDWRRWLLGSAALPVDRSFTWYGGYSLSGLSQWLVTTCSLAVAPFNVSFFGLALILALAPLFAAGYGAVRLHRGTRATLIHGCIIWLVSYTILFSSWQPFLDVYRISDLIPLWLMAAAALECIQTRVAHVAISAWLIGTGIFNMTQNILPRSSASANVPYQEALWIAKTTPENAWIVVSARGQVYIPYFAHRKPLNLRYFEGSAFDSFSYRSPLSIKFDELASRGEPIFITEATIESNALRRMLEDYGIILEREETGRKLYRVKRKEIPKGARRRN